MISFHISFLHLLPFIHIKCFSLSHWRLSPRFPLFCYGYCQAFMCLLDVPLPTFYLNFSEYFCIDSVLIWNFRVTSVTLFYIFCVKKYFFLFQFSSSFLPALLWHSSPMSLTEIYTSVIFHTFIELCDRHCSPILELSQHSPFLWNSHKCNHRICSLLSLAFLHLASCFWSILCTSFHGALFYSCNCWIVFRCMDTPHFTVLLTTGWTSFRSSRIMPLWLFLYNYLCGHIFISLR